MIRTKSSMKREARYNRSLMRGVVPGAPRHIKPYGVPSVKTKNSYQPIFCPYFRDRKKCDRIWPNDKAWPTTSQFQESYSDRNSMKVRVDIIGHYPLMMPKTPRQAPDRAPYRAYVGIQRRLHQYINTKKQVAMVSHSPSDRPPR